MTIALELDRILLPSDGKDMRVVFSASVDGFGAFGRHFADVVAANLPQARVRPTSVSTQEVSIVPRDIQFLEAIVEELNV